MTTRWTIPLAACTAVLLLARVSAAAPATPPASDQGQMVQMPAAMVRASSLIGTAVFDPRNQELGLIKEVLLDSQTGLGNFVVLDVNVPGATHSLIVVPYTALRTLRTSATAPDNRPSLVLEVQSEQLRRAPRIENNQWEVLRNPQFLEQALNFYQPREYTAARPVEGMIAPIGPFPCFVPQACCGGAPYAWTHGSLNSEDLNGWNDHG